MTYEIGNRIQKYRKLRGFSQKELAKKIGISSARLSNWELGINRPDVEMLAIICNILEISPNVLLNISSDSYSPHVLFSQEALEIARAYDAAIPEIQHAARALFSISRKS